MRFLQVKFLIPLLLVISTIFVGIALLRPPLDDITEELGDQCSPLRSEGGIRYCYVDEFSFSGSYKIIRVTTKNELCLEPDMRVPGMVLPPTEVKRIAGVTFLLSINPPAHTYCAFRLTIQFGNGERFHGLLVAEGGPRGPVERYELVITSPENGRPIAGMIYDTKTTEIFYLVTRIIY